MADKPVIEATDLRKEFHLGEQTIAAVDGVDLEIQAYTHGICWHFTNRYVRKSACAASAAAP